MSYEIIFEFCTLYVGKEEVVAQAQDFAVQQLGMSDEPCCNTDSFMRDLARRLRQQDIPVPPMSDLYILHMLIGCNNLFDTVTQKTVRSWQFCGVGTEYDLVLRFGCRWAASVEGGNIKLRGRWTKAENWIRALRQQLNNARHYSVFPHCPLSVFVEHPVDNDAARMEQFDRLKQRLLFIGATIKETQRYGKDGLRLSINAPSPLLMWWFQRIVMNYKGEGWIEGTEPPRHIVKHSSI
ncbi:hypothetical protein ACWX0P_00115 [Vibrio mediterranei]